MRDRYTAVDQIVISEEFSAVQVCQVLGVSRSGYAAWCGEHATRREQDDAQLAPIIEEVFWQHRRRYGARRIAVELNRRDLACGVARVARLMKTRGLRAIQPKSFQPKTTNSAHRLGYNENLLAAAEFPESINQVWVADLTYIPLRTRRFGYLSLLLDLCSRRIVGWEYGTTMEDEHSIAALKRAIKERQPQWSLVHHSDRGSQYASKQYRAVLRRARMRQSMSAAGNCYDNAFMESCFGTLKTELQLVDYADDAMAQRELTEYLHYYNQQRRHSGIGYDTPAEFERHQASLTMSKTLPK